MMNIGVCLGGKTKSLSMPEKSSIEKLLESMGINPETVVVLRNGEIVPESERLSNKDRIEIIDIVSGG
jgi:thiamine biosynthesis protein ThiS